MFCIIIAHTLYYCATQHFKLIIIFAEQIIINKTNTNTRQYYTCQFSCTIYWLASLSLASSQQERENERHARRFTFCIVVSCILYVVYAINLTFIIIFSSILYLILLVVIKECNFMVSTK